MVYRLSAAHHLRFSYQTGYRNPTNQNQYLDLAAGGGSFRMIGGLPEMIIKYDLYDNKPFTADSYYLYQRSLAVGKPDVSILKTHQFSLNGVQPESIQLFEAGDKILISDDLLLDAYAYYSIYHNFISETSVYQRRSDDFIAYNVPVNVPGDVKTYGAAAGIDYRHRGYLLKGNLSYNDISHLPARLANEYGFNTPKFRLNLGISKPDLFKNVGMTSISGGKMVLIGQHLSQPGR
ncbi:TonB-dependent receptor domain-containing protein [Mucilaginibacter defluvii]|uniref:TonB-dependent receptor-like beta-barrel domain-containing protein n=1 Tax=Mucilaginibacter defluvii TaxID=1196019 RepID=A0ABP9G4M3_9SPHI